MKWRTLSSLSSHPPHLPHRNSMAASALSSSSSNATSSSLPPLPEKRLVVGCGLVSADYVGLVDAFPHPDQKMRTRSLKVLGGGNVGNALTCAARLGLISRIITKVGNDSNGKSILAELESDGVDTSYVTVSKDGMSPFTYVIVDQQTKTRTCIYTPGFPPMIPDDLPGLKLISALDGARLLCLDSNLHRAAFLVAQEAARMNIPILIDAERKKLGLDDLLYLASYVVCAENFPQVWTSVPSTASALVSLLLRLARAKFVIVTLGCSGCIMIERRVNGEDPNLEVMEVESLMESLKMRVDKNNASPQCMSSTNLRLFADGIGTVSGRMLLGTAESIPSSEVVDTTGAGDAFVGATIYGLCAGMPPEKMLPFASQVAAAKCRAMGARTGLPRRTDPRLTPFLC